MEKPNRRLIHAAADKELPLPVQQFPAGRSPMRKTLCSLIFPALIWTSAVQAVKIADVTRLSGQRTNVLTGLGLVYGLKGTGDGGDYAAAIRPLAAMLGKFNDPVTVQELGKTQNVAIVNLIATIPSNGAAMGTISTFAWRASVRRQA